MSDKAGMIKLALVGIAVLALGLGPAQASGPGAAAKFVVLGSSSVYVGTMDFLGPVGAIGGYTVELTDKVDVHGNAIASASFDGGMQLGDNTTVQGKCITGGGHIDIEPKNPAKCLNGKNITGSHPLLTVLSDAMTDAEALSNSLLALAPTSTLAEINIPDATNETMSFGPGVNVIAVSGRFLVGSASDLTLRAPLGASVVFLASSGLSMAFEGKIHLAGGIKRNAVAYVVTDSVLLGVKSLVPGTIIATSGSCLAYDRAKISGALMCNGGIAFSNHAKMTFAPLRAIFP